MESYSTSSTSTSSSHTSSFAYSLFWLFFVMPLRMFYYKVYWRNKQDHDICSELTHVSSDHWVQQMDTCADLIERDIERLTYGVLCVLYFALLFHVVTKTIFGIANLIGSAIFRSCPGPNNLMPALHGATKELSLSDLPVRENPSGRRRLPENIDFNAS